MAVLMTAPVGAQVADAPVPATQKAALDRFAWMDGTWRGPATTRGPEGVHAVTQTERVGPMLGGTVRVIEGRGFNPDGSVGFNAFAVISYDAGTRAYQFRSYAQGHAGTFAITPTADGYVWEIPAGPAKIRYTASLRDGVWTETGERVVPGQPAVRIFEMALRRVGPTDWPGGGAMTPR